MPESPADRISPPRVNPRTPRAQVTRLPGHSDRSSGRPLHPPPSVVLCRLWCFVSPVVLHPRGAVSALWCCVGPVVLRWPCGAGVGPVVPRGPCGAVSPYRLLTAPLFRQAPLGSVRRPFQAAWHRIYRSRTLPGDKNNAAWLSLSLPRASLACLYRKEGRADSDSVTASTAHRAQHRCARARASSPCPESPCGLYRIPCARFPALGLPSVECPCRKHYGGFCGV
jgi:hypothetical protein